MIIKSLELRDRHAFCTWKSLMRPLKAPGNFFCHLLLKHFLLLPDPESWHGRTFPEHNSRFAGELISLSHLVWLSFKVYSFLYIQPHKYENGSWNLSSPWLFKCSNVQTIHCSGQEATCHWKKMCTTALHSTALHFDIYCFMMKWRIVMGTGQIPNTLT